MSTVATARQLCRDPHATRRKAFVPGAAVAHIARTGASPSPWSDEGRKCTSAAPATGSPSERANSV